MNKIERRMKTIHVSSTTLLLIYLLLNIALSLPILFVILIITTLGRASFRQSEGHKFDAIASLGLILFFLVALVISLYRRRMLRKERRGDDV